MSTEELERVPVQTEFDFMSDDAKITNRQISFEALRIRAEIGVKTSKESAGVAVLGNN
ncbi:hypothetical protein IPH92_02690 [Candidatus Kaiserbacteria bacterium]|nr:MAG: hypothetical protein IPH92_02690 [Candidatus Kaiserbacteria bacterium]